MIFRYYLGLLVLGVVLNVSGCGGGSGGGGGTVVPPIVPTITLTPSKNIALNVPTNDSITLRATVVPAVADGTVVTFLETTNRPGTSVFPVTATTVGSVATTVVTSSFHGTVTVVASTDHETGSATMKFIPQPVSAQIAIAMNKAVTGLSSLAFMFVNDSGASLLSSVTLNEAQINNATIVAGSQISNTSSVVLKSVIPRSFNTAANSPIIQLTYSISSPGIPGFQVGIPISATVFNAATGTDIPLSPALATSNFALTVNYFDGINPNPL